MAQQFAMDVLTMDKKELVSSTGVSSAERESQKSALESSLKGIDELSEQLGAAREAEEAANTKRPRGLPRPLRGNCAKR